MKIQQYRLYAISSILLITSFCFSSLSFGQDTLQVDTSLTTATFISQDSVVTYSDTSTSEVITVKPNNQKKKAKKAKIKKEPLSNKEEKVKEVVSDEDNNGLILIGILLVMIIVKAIISSIISKKFKDGTTSLKEDEYISDYLSRRFLSRREYYRNVYLKSEAWQRKRFVVLKRDEWRCVYCGGKATQVHHTRYAKRNIGKEPIEWLVSVCKTCHDLIH